MSAFAPKTSLHWGGPSKGRLLHEALKSGEGPFRGGSILDRQHDSPLPKNSMQVLCGLTQHQQQPWPIFWTHHPNARLVTEALALELPHKTIALESVYIRPTLGATITVRGWLDSRPLTALHRQGMDFDEICCYTRLAPPVHLAGNYTSIVSRWTPTRGIPNFSHWFLDALPRLALLKYFPSDTKILVPEKLASYQIESLRMMGLLDRVHFTSETNLIVQNYYFSSPVSMVVCDSPYSVDFLRTTFLPHASTTYSGPKRFVIDREGSSHAIVNREEFNRFFEKLGWAILKPENLNFAEELKLFAEAESICGMVGSGFTNAIWCKPGCKVIQIMPETLLDGSTEWICMHNNLEWRYLVCPGDLQKNAVVDLGRLAHLLRAVGLA